MRLLLGSGGFRTEERRDLLRSEMRRHFGEIERLLFVPYASGNHDLHLERMIEHGFNAGYELDGIHRHADPRRAVLEAEAISVGGGNTFRLIDALWQQGLIDAIRDRVRGGMPYMGVSAGANVACPTMMTTNDMPILQPPSFEALGLVPFQINAHYYHGQTHIQTADETYERHYGETRDQRIREFHELNPQSVLGLHEGTALRVDDDQLTLVGGPARLFRAGQDPLDLAPGIIQLPD